MEDFQLKGIVQKALDRFNENDIDLIKMNVSERAITHKMAVFIQELLPAFHVDVEYNADAGSPTGRKIIHLLKPQLQQYYGLEIGEEDLFGIEDTFTKHVVPDIIIHRRGTNENICAIEIKKSNSRIDFAYDHMKLQAYTTDFLGNHLNYKLGIFIEIQMNDPGRYAMAYYKDGVVIQSD